MDLTRRQILIGVAAGSGLLVAAGLLPRDYPLPYTPADGELPFGPWLRIGKDGITTVCVPQLEMGQGVLTLLAQVVAVELGADWRRVGVEMATVSSAFPNLPLAAAWEPLWMPLSADLDLARDSWPVRRWAEDKRFMVTGDGLSIPAYEAPARAAAAAARAVLAQAAARRWGCGWEQCEVSGGEVVWGGKRLGFGELVEEAARLSPPDPPVLRPRPAFETPATLPAGAALAFPRLDLPAKVDGSWQFAGDVRLPDMVYAAIRHAPRGRAYSLGSYDAARAKGISGFLRTVDGPNWFAAVARDWWAAERALSAIAPHFVVEHPADSAAIAAALDQALSGKPETIHEAGDPDAILGDHPQFSARYDLGPALHATPETASATARFRDGVLEIWVATQAPERLRQSVARALEMVPRKVILYPMAAGGSFDARYDYRVAVEAAQIARAVEAPVQLVWSRWQENLAGLPRAPMSVQVSARADTSGGIAAWRMTAAMPATVREFGRRLFEGLGPAQAAQIQNSVDPLALDGAMPPYAIPHLALAHAPARIDLPTGRMRGRSHAMHAFVTEGFVDEIASALKREPLGFRMAMLEHDPRLAACLQRVSGLAGWNGGQDNSGNGLACARMGDVAGGGCIAAIATARRSEQGVLVERIFAVADIGRIINADIARQQIEGGLIFGIGMALGASTGWRQGLPTARTLGDLDLPLLADCPEVEVEFVASEADPFDAGELGVAVAAPAIANALFSATGLRFRRLPLGSDE